MAALQASAAEFPALGAVVASGAGVAVGEGLGEAVAVEGGEVEEGRGAAVGCEVFVSVGEGVAVSGGDAGEAGITVGLTVSAMEGVAGNGAGL